MQHNNTNNSLIYVDSKLVNYPGNKIVYQHLIFLAAMCAISCHCTTEFILTWKWCCVSSLFCNNCQHTIHHHVHNLVFQPRLGYLTHIWTSFYLSKCSTETSQMENKAQTWLFITFFYINIMEKSILTIQIFVIRKRCYGYSWFGFVLIKN